MSQELITALTEIKQLFATPASWTQGSFARNASGETVLLTSPRATCFCLRGAVARLQEKDFSNIRVKTTFALKAELPDGFSTLVQFNDLKGYEDVVALIDRALTTASAS
jgi:hypothetical protein